MSVRLISHVNRDDDLIEAWLQHYLALGVTSFHLIAHGGVEENQALFGLLERYPIEIVVCPIVREPDGLAMSSRNVYLDPEQRKAATVLSRALRAAQELYETGERDAETLREKMKEVLAGEPLANVQYVSCADYDTLEELDAVTGKALLSMAVFVGKTRLIDNVILE